MQHPPHLVETAIGTLAVELPSSSPPDLWLWPGLFFDSGLHYPLARALAKEGIHVAHINPPGFGGSTFRGRRFTVRQCGQAMLAVLDAFDIPTAVLGGTSWGGMTTLRAAIDSPERVRGMVLLNAPVDGANPDALLRMTPALSKSLPPALLGLAFLPHCLAPGSMLAHGRSTAAMLRSSLRSAPPQVRADVSRSLLLHAESPRDHFASLHMPTLQIAGALDRLCPVARQRSAAALLPNVRYLEFPDKGHLAAVEATDATAAAITEFLGSLKD